MHLKTLYFKRLVINFTRKGTGISLGVFDMSLIQTEFLFAGAKTTEKVPLFSYGPRDETDYFLSCVFLNLSFVSLIYPEKLI